MWADLKTLAAGGNTHTHTHTQTYLQSVYTVPL